MSVANQTILVADLLLDEENPRLPAVQDGQDQALREMAKKQGAKLRFLAEDIATFGLDPSYRLIVMPSKREAGRFVVLDGNRRLTAIRALEDPDAVDGVVGHRVVDAIRELSGEYSKHPVRDADCLVVSERGDADHWIELRHTGQHRGAGVVGWASGEASRFRARRSGRADIATQALDFLEERGYLSPELRSEVRASTLGRLLGTRDVRPLVGFEVRDGQFTPMGDEAAVAETLLHAAKDLASGEVSVGDLYTSKQRVEYAEGLVRRTAPVPVSGSDSDEPQSGHTTEVRENPSDEPGDPGTDRATAFASRRPRLGVAERDILIPPNFRMNVTSPRLRKIEMEIRELSLSRFPNANAVFFRVFMELTADEYIDRATLVDVDVNSRLPAKLNAVTNHLVANGLLSDQEAQPVRRAAQANSYDGIGTLIMNQWIHNRHMFPSAGELRTGWDNLQPWYAAIWPLASKRGSVRG